MNYWIFIATIISILPIFFIREYNKTNNFYYILLSLLCYIVLTICYIKLLTNEHTGMIYTLLQVLQIILVVIFSKLIFHESLDTFKIIAVFFAILSIYFMELKR